MPALKTFLGKHPEVDVCEVADGEGMTTIVEMVDHIRDFTLEL